MIDKNEDSAFGQLLTLALPAVIGIVTGLVYSGSIKVIGRFYFSLVSNLTVLVIYVTSILLKLNASKYYQPGDTLNYFLIGICFKFIGFEKSAMS